MGHDGDVVWRTKEQVWGPRLPAPLLLRWGCHKFWRAVKAWLPGSRVIVWAEPPAGLPYLLCSACDNSNLRGKPEDLGRCLLPQHVLTYPNLLIHAHHCEVFFQGYLSGKFLVVKLLSKRKCTFEILMNTARLPSNFLPLFLFFFFSGLNI